MPEWCELNIQDKFTQIKENILSLNRIKTSFVALEEAFYIGQNVENLYLFPYILT